MMTRFVSRWGTDIPPAGPATPVVCPNCGGSATMDRVGPRIYGWHDTCGWQASLRVIRRGDELAVERW